MPSQKELISYLRQNSIHASFLDRLKMVYRPMVCPFSQLLGYVNDNDIVADVGCGSGQFCLLVAGFAKPKALYGYEIYDSLIENANEIFKDKADVKHHFEVFNGTDFPDEIGTADVIFLIDVLHHIPIEIREQFMRNLYTKMKSEAKLIIKDIDGGSPFVIFNKMHDLIFYRQFVHEYSMNKTKKILEDLNLRVSHFEKKRMYVYPHYTLVATK